MDRGSSSYDTFDAYRFVPAASFLEMEARIKRLTELVKGHSASGAMSMRGDGDLASPPPQYLQTKVAETLAPSTASTEMTADLTPNPNTDIDSAAPLVSCSKSENCRKKEDHSSSTERDVKAGGEKHGDDAKRKESDDQPRPPYYLEGPYNFRDKHDW